MHVEDNDATLAGTVVSEAHRDAAVAVAASARGVAHVHDQLTVRSQEH